MTTSFPGVSLSALIDDEAPDTYALAEQLLRLSDQHRRIVAQVLEAVGAQSLPELRKRRKKEPLADVVQMAEVDPDLAQDTARLSRVHARGTPKCKEAVTAVLISADPGPREKKIATADGDADP